MEAPTVWKGVRAVGAPVGSRGAGVVWKGLRRRRRRHGGGSAGGRRRSRRPPAEPGALSSYFAGEAELDGFGGGDVFGDCYWAEA